MQKTYIFYTLSKDRTTQKFKKNKIADIVKDLEYFFENCTSTKFSNPDTIELTAYTAHDQTDPAELIDKIISKTTKRFGFTDKEPIAYHYPSGEPHSTCKFKWRFSKENLQEVILFLIDFGKLPKATFGPLELTLSYGFNLIVDSKYAATDIDNTSILCIWFSRNQSCSPTLYFPFEQADTLFWNYLDELQASLPFQLEEKYLRIAHVNKRGEINSFKKIVRPVNT